MEHNDPQSRETPSFAARQDVLPEQTPYSNQSPTNQRYRQPAFPYEQSTFRQTSAVRPSIFPGGVHIESLPYTYSQGGQLLGSNLQSASAQQVAPFVGGAERSEQEFQPYGHGMLFAVPSHTSSQTPPARHDPSQQYPQRSGAALDVLSTSYNFPQQYYIGDNTRPLRGSDIPHPSQVAGQALSQYPPTQYSQTGHDPRGSTSTSAYSNIAESEPLIAPHSAHDNTRYNQPTQSSQITSDYDNTYDAYQTELKRVYGYMHDGQLSEASHNLLAVSRWLLGNVEALGLVRDDETLHSQRLALWEEFNNCWLALLQSQKEKVVMVLRTGQHLRPEESTISQDSLEEMGKELVDLCDGMERYGLVDYQLGVWEEQIIAVLTQCLDLLDNVNEQSAG